MIGHHLHIKLHLSKEIMIHILCNQIYKYFLEYIGVKFPYSFPTPPPEVFITCSILILHLSNRHYYYLIEEKI
jgi:hypothetical protein